MTAASARGQKVSSLFCARCAWVCTGVGGVRGSGDCVIPRSAALTDPPAAATIPSRSRTGNCVHMQLMPCALVPAFAYGERDQYRLTVCWANSTLRRARIRFLRRLRTAAQPSYRDPEVVHPGHAAPFFTAPSHTSGKARRTSTAAGVERSAGVLNGASVSERRGEGRFRGASPGCLRTL